jgi:hypothetical protein
VKRRKRRFAIAALVGATILAIWPTPAARAQSAPSAPMLKLYVDSKGQVFTTPARDRRLLTEIPASALATQDLEKRIEQKTQAQLEQNQAQISDIAHKNADLAQQNQVLTKQVADMTPAWQNFSSRWLNKISIGTLVFADYRFMSHTGFGPQFLDTAMNWPGPGNNSFNAFDITRGYLDFKFTPTDDFMMRLTPDVYSTIGTATATTVGKNTSYASALSGNLGYRLKYGYLDYNTFFRKILRVNAMSDDQFTFGQQPNPLVDWEEHLYGFRYVNLTPWNYLGLSSTQLGASIKGPIKFNEKQYLDYDVGVYNDASYHAQQIGAMKQVMGRVTYNPFGAESRYDSLGITAFMDYGWLDSTPDTSGTGGSTVSWRSAFLLHYTAKHWAIAAEYDVGKDAFSSGNLFSGSGPITTGTFGPWNTMVGDILNHQASQQGYDFFGHVDIPRTPFAVFGMFQAFEPNTKVNKDPLDFQRWVVGLDYKVNDYFRFAVDTQNITYYHDQFTFPGQTLGPTVVPVTAFSVPRDTHAFMLNMEFRY